MEKVNNKKEIIVKGAKGLAYLAKWFLVGYGLASVIIDFKDGKKEA